MHALVISEILLTPDHIYLWKCHNPTDSRGAHSARNQQARVIASAAHLAQSGRLWRVLDARMLPGVTGVSAVFRFWHLTLPAGTDAETLNKSKAVIDRLGYRGKMPFGELGATLGDCELVSG